MITGLVGVWILPENETMRTRSIRVSSINPKYRSQNGALYNKKMTTLICYPMSKKVSTFVVPDTVRKTAPLSFRGNYYLEKVVLPKNLRKLGRGSFFDCVILRDVNLEELSHLERISDYHNKSNIRIMHYIDTEAEDTYDHYLNGVDYSDGRICEWTMVV